MKSKATTFAICGLVLAMLAFCTATWAADDRSIKRNTADGTKRTALVIGNSAYNKNPLKNPQRDATAIAEQLRQSGFDAVLVTDADKKAMERAIKDFGAKLTQGGAGLFYFAGHGMQIGGRNYLLPVDVSIESESDVEYEAIDAGRVLGKMEDADNGLNIVILDACRDNPFARGFRSTGASGLAKMDAPTGSFIAYATKPGSVASDGQSDHSPYTKALLSAIRQPGLNIEQLFKNVRNQVMRDTDNKQVPWEASSLRGDFHFAGAQNVPSPAPPAAQPGPRIDAEEEYWLAIKDSSSIGDLERYKKEHPNGRFTKVADLKADKLRQQAAAQQAPAKPAATASSSPPAVSSGSSTSIPPSTYTDPTTGMEFVYVPGGEFEMGNTFGDHFFTESKDTYKVRIEGFWMGKYEVTQGEWMKVMGSNPSKSKLSSRHPVELVKWKDVEKFIERLHLQSGRNYRLPTEAEWEYAARSGGKAEKWAGTSDESRLGDYAWYEKNSRDSTSEVGKKLPNGLGLYDMTGNVSEWVAGWYMRTPLDKDQSQPTTGGLTTSRVTRGGAFNTRGAPREIRNDYRDHIHEDASYTILGFRLLLQDIAPGR